ncbi:MAG TPA: hypothetical protein VMB84_01485, partial [Stellaceae bacterium]|nr:hypothetical protein [Stellaceae bacterium]
MPIEASPEQIAKIFDDRQVQRLAALAKLPGSSDRKQFAEGIRAAARGYAEAVRRPNDNQLRAEIAALYRAASRREFDDVARLIENLSDAARVLLEQRVRPAVEIASITVSGTGPLYRIRR